ncbi:hypothetical protein KR067_004115, partial [Drosophila pandora]
MDMIVSEWKKVDLFGIAELSSLKCLTDSDIACYCCNVTTQNEEPKVTVVFCEKSGLIYISSKLDLIKFKGKLRQKAASFCALTSSNLLAIVTQDTNFGSNIDLYDLRRLIKGDEAPLFAWAYVDVSCKVSCINVETIDDNFLALGLGLENGDILLHYGKIIPSTSLNMRRYSISENPINGLYFDINKQRSNTQTCNMYASCSIGVISFFLKDNSEIVTNFQIGNEKGHYNDFCTIRKSEDDKMEESMFVVGRDDAVYCYTRDGRGPCFAIEGKKKFISWVGQYLFVAINSTQFPNRNQITSLIVVDTYNKVVVLVKQVENFLCAICGFEFAYITKSKDSNVMVLNMIKEYDLNKKVRLLIEKNMYEIALRSLNYEDYAYSFDAAYIRFLYGNYLLLKGDVESAVNEYIKTIGFTKPSSVISKLLYMRYNENLINYLSEVEKIEPSKTVRKLHEFCLNSRHLNDEINQLKFLFDSKELESLLKHYQGFQQISNLPTKYFKPANQNDKYGKEDFINHLFHEDIPKDSTFPRSSELATNLNKSLLMAFKSACTNESNLLLKIKPIVVEKSERFKVESTNEKGAIKYLNTKIKSTKYKLLSFTHNPIEFRNDTCDICGETLGSQSIYFLCQHSFHKECLNYRALKYKDLVCVTCAGEKYSILDEKSSVQFLSESFDIVIRISKLFSLGIK